MEYDHRLTEQRNELIVIELWRRMSDLRFRDAGTLLAEDVVCEWPLTRERIRGRANYVAVNEAYPGEWKITVEEAFSAGDRVVTRCRLEWDGRVNYALSFFTVGAGLITHEVDWWPEPYDPPAGREHLVERMADDETPITL